MNRWRWILYGVGALFLLGLGAAMGRGGNSTEVVARQRSEAVDAAVSRTRQEDEASKQAAVGEAVRRAKAEDEDAISNAKTSGEAAAQQRSADLDRRQADLDQRQTDLDARQGQLDRRQAGLDAREKSLESAQAKANADSFGDGEWVVGKDIQPGTYRAADAGSHCYWAKVKNDEGIIDNDIPNGPTTVTIDPAVPKFKSHDCGTWRKVG